MRELYGAAFQVRVMTSMITKLATRDLEQRLLTYAAGVSALQYGVLRLLSYQQQTISELGRKMMLSPATLVPVVDALERQGLVKRERDLKDRRRIPLLVTEAGRLVLAKVPNVDEDDLMVKTLSQLGLDKSHTLLGLLREAVGVMSHDGGMTGDIAVTVNGLAAPGGELMTDRDMAIFGAQG